MTEKWLKTAPPQTDSTKMNTQASEQTLKSSHFANFARVKRLEGSFGMKVNRGEGNATPGNLLTSYICRNTNEE